MEEMLDIYTRDGKYLGVKTRSECHTKNPGFTINQHGHGFIIQKMRY